MCYKISIGKEFDFRQEKWFQVFKLRFEDDQELIGKGFQVRKLFT